MVSALLDGSLPLHLPLRSSRKRHQTPPSNLWMSCCPPRRTRRTCSVRASRAEYHRQLTDVLLPMRACKSSDYMPLLSLTFTQDGCRFVQVHGTVLPTLRRASRHSSLGAVPHIGQGARDRLKGVQATELSCTTMHERALGKSDTDHGYGGQEGTEGTPGQLRPAVGLMRHVHWSLIRPRLVDTASKCDSDKRP